MAGTVPGGLAAGGGVDGEEQAGLPGDKFGDIPALLQEQVYVLDGRSSGGGFSQ